MWPASGLDFLMCAIFARLGRALWRWLRGRRTVSCVATTVTLLLLYFSRVLADLPATATKEGQGAEVGLVGVEENPGLRERESEGERERDIEGARERERAKNRERDRERARERERARKRGPRWAWWASRSTLNPQHNVFIDWF